MTTSAAGVTLGQAASNKRSPPIVDRQGTFQLTGGDKVTSAGDLDIAFAKVSSDGKVVWTKSFGGAVLDMPRDLAVGRNGEIAMTGEFEAQSVIGGPRCVVGQRPVPVP